MKKTKRLLFIAIAFSLINSLVVYFFFDKGGYHLTGEYEPNQSLFSILSANFIAVPIISFLLGLLVALIPIFKGKYGNRYLPTSLLNMVIIQAVFFVVIFIRIISGSNISSNANHYILKGNSFFASEQYDKAFESYNNALKINPNDSYALKGKADCFLDLAELDSAMYYYTASIKNNYENYDAYAKRAMTQCFLGQYESAVIDCNKAIKGTTQKTLLSDIYIFRALAKINLNDTIGFIDDIEIAIEYNPYNEVAFEHLGIHYANIGEVEKAIETLEKAGEEGQELINQIKSYNR